MAYRRRPPVAQRAGDNDDDSDQITLANTKRYIHRLTVRIGDLLLTRHSPMIAKLIQKGELFGFTLRYKIPVPQHCPNNSLAQEIIVRSVSHSDMEVKFKHKKVFSIVLDSDLINTWDKMAMQMTLTMEVARNRDRNDAKIQVLARTVIPLTELLIPPFSLTRDQSMVAEEFTMLLSVGLELGSRNANVNERLEALKKLSLDDTFNMQQRPARHTRTRSSSRCRSCSPDRPKRIVPRPIPHIPRERFELSPRIPRTRSVEAPPPPTIPNPLTSLPERLELPSGSSTESDSVFEHENRPLAIQQPSGALRLELTLHEARDLPLVRDDRGMLVPPRAFVKILSRNEQIQSSVAEPSRNPVWNWTGDFVFSAERGNLVIKFLHTRDNGSVDSLGLVTLNRPFESFQRSTFEITILVPQTYGNATVTLSLKVQPYRASSAVELCQPTRNERISRNELRTPSYSSTVGESDILRWSGTRGNPRLVLTTRNSRNSYRSRSPPFDMEIQEDTSHLLKDHLNQLDNIMLPIRARNY